MHASKASDGCAGRRLGKWRRHLRPSHLRPSHLRPSHLRPSHLTVALLVSMLLALPGCDRSGSGRAAAAAKTNEIESPGPPAPPTSPARLALAETWNNGRPREVYAAWYDVPDDSLAARRAGEKKYTAAHNRLPIGTLVRVTHLANGRSVLVRITDRGIPPGKVKIDLCKEAAEELGMLSKGLARVRMQVVVETSGSDPQTEMASHR